MVNERSHAFRCEKIGVVEKLAQKAVGVLRQAQIDIAEDGRTGTVGAGYHSVEGWQRKKFASRELRLQRHEIEHGGAKRPGRREDRVIELARQFAVRIAAIKLPGEIGQKGGEADGRLQPGANRHVGDEKTYGALELRPDPVGGVGGGKNFPLTAPLRQRELKRRQQDERERDPVCYRKGDKTRENLVANEEIRAPSAARLFVMILGQPGGRHLPQFFLPIPQMGRQIGIQRAALALRIIDILRRGWERAFFAIFQRRMDRAEFLQQHLRRPSVRKIAMGKEAQRDVSLLVAESANLKSLLGIKIHGAFGEFAHRRRWSVRAILGKFVALHIYQCNAGCFPILHDLDRAAILDDKPRAQSLVAPHNLRQCVVDAAHIGGRSQWHEHGIGERHIGGEAVHPPKLFRSGRQGSGDRILVVQSQNCPGAAFDPLAQRRGLPNRHGTVLGFFHCHTCTFPEGSRLSGH